MAHTPTTARRPATGPRRTQQQRRESTRAALLDATVACLVEHGHAGTTVADVLAHAGVARGTLLHHFPTKNDLLAAAVSHVAAQRADRWDAEVAALPARTDRVDAMVDLAWRDLSSPVFAAALELWVAARTDAELRAALVPVEAHLVGRIRESLVAALGPAYADDRRAGTLVQFTIDLLTGLALSTVLTGDTDGGRELVLRRWKRALRVLFGELDAGSLTRGR